MIKEKNNSNTFKEMPKEWMTKKIGDIGDVTDGDWILKNDYTKEGTRLLQVGDIGNGRFVNKSNRFINNTRASELKCTVIDMASDILIARMPQPTGRACLAPMLDYPYIVSVDISILKVNQNIANTQYVLQALKHKQYFNQIERLVSGATRERISRKNLEEVILLLPPIKEQQEIAEILVSIDEAIEICEQKIRTTEKLKKGMMQRLLTRGIGHTKFKKTELGEIPEEWEIVRLNNRDYFELETGSTPPKSNKEYWQGGDLEWATPVDLTKKYLKSTDRKITKKALDENASVPFVPKGSLIVSTRAPIGLISIAEVDMSFNQGCKAITCKRNTPEYIYYAMLTKVNEMKRVGAGSTFLEISKENFEKIAIALPGIDEETKILNILNNTDGKIDIDNERKEKLIILKQGLMNELLAGKKRVKVI